MSKESFELYLKKVKQEAGDKIKPEKEFFGCPICGFNGKIELKKEKLTHAVPPYAWRGDFYVYKCPKCKEGFTTSESDTISIATLKPKKQ